MSVWSDGVSSFSLGKRELVRFCRQRSRFLGALGTPLIFWFLLGSGIGSHFQSPLIPAGTGYLEYLFPGTLVLIVMMTSVFSTISLIQDREGGFLQSVLVAPVSSWTVVGGKVLGGVFLSVSQVALLLLLAPLVGFELSIANIVGVLLVSVFVSFALTAMGFLFAWKINSVQGFHAIMNLILFPLWLLSGAIFPVKAAPMWLQVVMWANPLAHGLNGIKQFLYVTAPSSSSLSGFSSSLSVLFVIVFGLIFFIQSGKIVQRGAY